MPKSSAWGIPYEIRPSKQVERRLVMETVALSRLAGVEPGTLRFVGMGGVRYIDFLLAHKILGINDYVSLEHDESLWERCELNKPFDTLEVFRGSASDFLEQRGFDRPSVVWFDLEKMASKDAQVDIVGAATSVQPGSFLFVTATAELPSDLDSLKMDRRFALLKDRFAPLADGLQASWTNKKDFHKASAFLARSFLSHGFSGRSDGKFYPLVHIAYRDSSWMTTIGGYFGEEAIGAKIYDHIAHCHPFLIGDADGCPFVLEQFNLTEVERALFDRASTATPRKRSARNKLERLGFRESIISQYRDLMRFIPRYVETAF